MSTFPGNVEGRTGGDMSTYPGGVWREGLGRDVSTYPRGVWREGPGRDISTYLGECGGKGQGEM